MKNKIVLNSNLKWLLIITILSTLIFIMLTVILIMVDIIFKGLNNVGKFDYKWYWKLALYFIVSCGLLFVIMHTILLINLILLTNSLKKNNNVIPSKNENILKIINFIIISFTFFSHTFYWNQYIEQSNILKLKSKNCFIISFKLTIFTLLISIIFMIITINFSFSYKLVPLIFLAILIGFTIIKLLVLIVVSYYARKNNNNKFMLFLINKGKYIFLDPWWNNKYYN